MKFAGCHPASDYSAFDRIFDLATSLIAEKDIVQAMAICIKEEMSNSREWALGMDLTKPIYLSIDVTKMQITVTIMDTGNPWREDGFLYEPDAEARLMELVETEAERGRGKYICALLCHSLEYQNGGRVRVMAWMRNPWVK